MPARDPSHTYLRGMTLHLVVYRKTAHHNILTCQNQRLCPIQQQLIHIVTHRKAAENRLYGSRQGHTTTTYCVTHKKIVDNLMGIIRSCIVENGPARSRTTGRHAPETGMNCTLKNTTSRGLPTSLPPTVNPIFAQAGHQFYVEEPHASRHLCRIARRQGQHTRS